MSKKILALGIGLLIIGGIVWSLFVREQPTDPASGKIKVSASFYPLYFLAQAIGGERADVVNITPAGVEPHDYELTGRELARIADSDLVILNGGGLENWQDGAAASIDAGRTLLIVVGEGLADREREADGKTEMDPHIWLDPALAAVMADRIAAAFIRADPAGRVYYENNLSRLKDSLASLDSEYRETLATCARRDIITSHAAFAYLAAAYNLHQVPISGLEPEAEPSPRELADIVEFARASGIKYIFFEKLASPELSATLAREIGAQTLVLNPLEGLSEEDLVAGRDYLSEMRANLENLRIALGCAD